MTDTPRAPLPSIADDKNSFNQMLIDMANYMPGARQSTNIEDRRTAPETYDSTSGDLEGGSNLFPTPDPFSLAAWQRGFRNTAIKWGLNAQANKDLERYGTMPGSPEEEAAKDKQYQNKPPGEP